MMTKLREFSKIFIIVIALSFIALMVFEWGMGGFGGGAQNIVGSVNGKEMTYTMFSEMYQDMYEQERTRSGKTDFSEEDLQRMKNQVWERFIQQTLFQQEMEKLISLSVILKLCTKFIIILWKILNSILHFRQTACLI